MNKIERLLELTRFLILCMTLLLVPWVIDIRILIGAGPETKFRFFEFGVFLAFFFSLLLYLKRPPTLRFSLLSIALILFAVYMLIRAWLDSHYAYALDHALRSVSWVLFALLVADSCGDWKRLRTLLFIACIAQVGVVVYAWSYTVGLDVKFNVVMLGKEWRYGNPLVNQDRGVIWALGNPNYYACFAVMLAIITTTVLALAKRWWSRLGAVLFLSLILYTLFYTQNRGVWVGLLPSIGILVILITIYYTKIASASGLSLRRWFKWGGLVLLAGIILISSLFAIQYKQGSGLIYSLGKRFYHLATFQDISLRARPLLWCAALQMWKEEPLIGQGHGRFSPGFLTTVYNLSNKVKRESIQQLTRHMNSILANRTHNEYLQFLAETGSMGFALLLLVILSGLGTTVQILYQGNLSRFQFIALVGCTALLLQTAFHSLFDFPLRLPASAMLFALGLGGILSLHNHSPKHFPSTWSRWILAIVLLPITVYLGVVVVQHYLATHLHFRAQNLIRDSRIKYQNDAYTARSILHTAQGHLSMANRLYPNNGQILFEMGGAYFYLSAYPDLGMAYRNRAVDRMERAIETYATPTSFKQMVNVYISKTQYSSAQRYADILLMIDPERDEIQYLAGIIDFTGGRFEEAEQHFKLEIKHNPTHADSYFYLAKVYEKKEHYTLAANMYEKSVELAPNVMLYHERLADLYAFELNKTDKAFKHYEYALLIAEELDDSFLLDRIKRKIRKLQRRLE